MAEQEVLAGCAPSECGTKAECAGCPHAGGAQHQGSGVAKAEGNVNSAVKRVIGVMSGKGGVGKSTVTALLASALQRQGYRVGVLDADITGPSAPRLFGLHGGVGGNEYGMFPAKTHNGIVVMSINLLLEKEEEPVVWRGPVLSGIIRQFWTDVQWGNLDVLLIDMPPGTGDVPLTVFQSLPVDGVIVVTSPQQMVAMIVEKACRMARQMGIPIVGMIENYAYVQCPDCGKRITLFGEGGAAELAKTLSMPLLAQLPVESALSALADGGEIEKADMVQMQPAVDALIALL